MPILKNTEDENEGKGCELQGQNELKGYGNINYLHREGPTVCLGLLCSTCSEV